MAKRLRDAKGRYLPGKSNVAVATPRRRRATASVTPKVLENHFIMVCDGSGSMGVHRGGAARLFNEQLDIIQSSKSQQNAVTVFHFGLRDDRQPIKEINYNAVPQAVARLDGRSYPAQGNTPLYDAVLKAGRRALSSDDGVKSFVMIVLTDGEENSSYANSVELQRFIREQQATDRWTFVFLVPKGYKHAFVSLSGVHDGNVREWDNIETAREELLQGAQLYISARASGQRSTRSWFTTDLSDVTKNDISKLRDITNEVAMWTVDKEANVREFVNAKSGGQFTRGCAFFEVMKKEKEFQDYKKLLIMDKATKRIYADGGRTSVRAVCGFPDTGDVAIDPGNHANFVLLAQSTSLNRILPRGTKLAFWPNA